MEDKKISIIISVFNTKKRHLKQAIESVLGQTYQNFEIIIIDNNSNLKTKKYLKSLNDDRINLIENEDNISLAESLNKGLNFSTGEYVVRLDSDEIMLPERLQKQLNFMEKNENVGVSICGYAYKKQEFFPPNGKDALKEILKKGNHPFDNSSLMIKKDVLGETRYSETFKHAENLSLLLKLFDKTEFASLHKALIKKRKLRKRRPKKYLFEQTLNNQTIIYLNMEKFYNQACGEEFRIIRKLKDGKRIYTREFRKLFEKQDIIKPHPWFEKYVRRRCLNPFVAIGIVK